MSSGGANILDIAEIANSEVPVVPLDAKTENNSPLTISEPAPPVYVEALGYTEEDLRTLRRVRGKIPWQAFSITFIEFCERFSYYGTTVVWTNYIQQKLPPGSTTGANHGSDNFRSGAFGLGQRSAFAATTFNSFWAYFMPIFGAWIADEYLGRFNTILCAIFVAIFGHIILIISALPPVLVHPHQAYGIFWLGMVIMGIGTGGFKSNISPLIAEQAPETTMRAYMTKKGERVIMDPAINIGAMIGQISMVYAEQNVGFWLSFTLPTILFCLCPMVMFACRNQYHRSKPTGSVAGKALKLWALAAKGRWSLNPVTTIRNLRRADFWENVKPSKLGNNKPVWMTFDDAWVDEVRRGLKACTVFCWYPFYWLTYNQMTNNLTSQAATMELNGVPNDLIQNIDPIALIIFIPICDMILYPYLRRRKIRFTAIKRIFMGFMLGVAAMLVACIIQYYIYQKGPKPCYKKMNTCANILSELADTTTKPYAPINVWVQIPAFVLIALSEIFASITGLEYAFTKAPASMRSLVMSLFLFMSAISAALSQAFIPLSDDPLLVWNYAIVALIAFIVGIAFWFSHRKLDAQDDELNMLPPGKIGGFTENTTVGDLEHNRARSHNVDQPIDLPTISKSHGTSATVELEGKGAHTHPHADKPLLG